MGWWDRDDFCIVGAEYLAAVGGVEGVLGYYYEVEVLIAKGDLCIGFAGTNLGPQCMLVGKDACGWSFIMQNGEGFHRCVRGERWSGEIGGLLWVRDAVSGKRRFLIAG